MRNLNKRQKKLLDKVVKENPDKTRFDQLSLEVIEELERMNDHETIVQNVDRYLEDKFFN